MQSPIDVKILCEAVVSVIQKVTGHEVSVDLSESLNSGVVLLNPGCYSRYCVNCLRDYFRKSLQEDGIEILVHILRISLILGNVVIFRSENLFLFNEGLKKLGLDQAVLITRKDFVDKDVGFLSLVCLQNYRIAVGLIHLFRFIVLNHLNTGGSTEEMNRAGLC